MTQDNEHLLRGVELVDLLDCLHRCLAIGKQRSISDSEKWRAWAQAGTRYPLKNVPRTLAL